MEDCSIQITMDKWLISTVKYMMDEYMIKGDKMDTVNWLRTSFSHTQLGFKMHGLEPFSLFYHQVQVEVY